jgi:Zn-dependent M28 family amino/carboxypeptidase
MRKTLQTTALLVAIALFIFSICWCFTFSLEVFAETTTDTHQLLREFVTDNPNRVAGTDGERNAMQWLQSRLLSYGFSDTDITTQLIDEQATASYNLIASIRPAGALANICIGAHYDTIAASVGATDNASGVVALLNIANELKNSNSLLYNIDIVFFGSEEPGLYGSVTYASRANSIDLMINIDSIGGGDNLYIMTEEYITDFQKAFVINASSAPATLHNKPTGVGVNFSYDVYGYGYYQTVQNSDHTPFRQLGIPTVLFISGNFDLLRNDYIESRDDSFRVMNTSGDTLVNLERRGMEFVNKIDTVTQSVVSTLTDANSIAAITTAGDQLVSRTWFNSGILTAVTVGIAVVVIIFAMLHYRKLQKYALLNRAEVNTTNVFTSPAADNIFDLDDTPKKDTPNDDDIFKF